MNPNRNLWPYGILLAFGLFVSGTVALIVIACRNDSDLVSAEYYEEEIRFQAHIDGARRAHDLTTATPVVYEASQKQIRITLPRPQGSPLAKGTIQLYRPSAAAMDRSIELEPDANGVQVIDAALLEPGLWKVKVIWTAAGLDFRVDEKVIIEARRS
ncbi:MAG TPA: FixH family protein [Verrucomicrobiae bacterium]|nr:FixH family protein [Verrucomicrobiae bacterium]